MTKGCVLGDLNISNLFLSVLNVQRTKTRSSLSSMFDSKTSGHALQVNTVAWSSFLLVCPVYKVNMPSSISLLRHWHHGDSPTPSPDSPSHHSETRTPTCSVWEDVSIHPETENVLGTRSDPWPKPSPNGPETLQTISAVPASSYLGCAYMEHWMETRSWKMKDNFPCIVSSCSSQHHPTMVFPPQ